MVAKEMGYDGSKMPITSFYQSDEKLNLEVETMVTFEMTQALSELNQANYQAAMKFIRYLLSTQSKQETSVVDTSKRFGISQGNLQVPDDIDFCNDEIADLFGVK